VGKVLLGFGKILYSPIAPKLPDSCFDKTEIHFKYILVPQILTSENSLGKV
jgi:hypothetical protein